MIMRSQQTARMFGQMIHEEPSSFIDQNESMNVGLVPRLIIGGVNEED